MITETSPTKAQNPDRVDNSRLRVVGVVAAVVIVLDQLTKIWAVSALESRTIDLFWTLRFRLHFNTGASFSLGTGFGRWLAVLIFFVVLAIIAYSRTIRPRLARILLGAILGGALGNLADRVFRADDGFLSGAVVDFIDFQWWPVFNVADMAVVCGAIAMMLYSLWADDELLDSPAPETAAGSQSGLASAAGHDQSANGGRAMGKLETNERVEPNDTDQAVASDKADNDDHFEPGEGQ